MKPIRSWSLALTILLTLSTLSPAPADAFLFRSNRSGDDFPIARRLLLRLRSAKPAPAPPSRPDIVELAQSDPELSTLVAAVTRAGVGPLLSGDGPFTVFAPTNAAFDAFLADNGLTSIDQASPALLAEILSDHVVEDEVRASRLAFLDRTDDATPTLGGLALEADARPLQVNDVDVVRGDLRARNGVVHVIDAVLVDPDPRPSIADLAADTESLSILLAAVERAGLDRLLAFGGPFTVFAPTNDAFLALLDDLGASSLDDIDDTTLINVLLDHIVLGERDAREIGRRETALGGLPLRFDPAPTTVNGIPIALPDVEARNGTVHVIEGVLLD